MEIKVVAEDILSTQNDAIVVGLFEDGQSDLEQKTDKALDNVISELVRRGEIKKKFREMTLIHTLGKLPSSRLLVAGLGKESEFNLDRVRNVSADICKTLRQKGSKSISMALPSINNSGARVSPPALVQAITEGVLLGSYTFRKYITSTPDYSDPESFSIVTDDSSQLPVLKESCNLGRIISEATNRTRDIVNEPPNVLTPTELAAIASKMAESSKLGIRIIDREEMETLGMGGILGVSQGSRQPPKFIVLEYHGRADKDLDLALAGKGITFDSGGISLKPSASMDEMKMDMSGAAAVLNVMGAVSEIKPVVNVTGIMPATENLPGGRAMRPGDILKMMNGKTVEIISPDAEGRLILADGLCYAGQLGAKRIVDIATLTGSCQVALGDVSSGILGNDTALMQQIVAVGEQAGEHIWQLPLFEEYKELVKSSVADMKNSGGRYAGEISAACFLKEFVGDIPWAHLDIAGTVKSEKDNGYQIKGATGVGVRTLINLVISLAAH